MNQHRAGRADDVLTSGGVAAGIDLCLHLVRKDHGAEVANNLARKLVFEPHTDGGQAQFVDQPVAGAFDRRLDPALTWALQHLADIFRRHFASQAGLSPNAYRRTFGQLNGEHDAPAPAQTL